MTVVAAMAASQSPIRVALLVRVMPASPHRGPPSGTAHGHPAARTYSRPIRAIAAMNFRWTIDGMGFVAAAL
ncbi:hypothetical protein Afe04nite_09890 [Asanoa ferruginea]|nr:hypothetical protein Afe04nite_09890 [Asanoa ferruginea]